MLQHPYCTVPPPSGTQKSDAEPPDLGCYYACLLKLLVSVPELDGEEGDISEGDVQKKLVPWRAMLPEEELELEVQEDYNKKRRNVGSMILVTSLIGKIPNLGGGLVEEDLRPVN